MSSATLPQNSLTPYNDFYTAYTYISDELTKGYNDFSNCFASSFHIPAYVLGFIYDRVPNIYESSTGVFMQSTLESAVKYLDIQSLNEMTDSHHPGAQLIFRNTLKLPTTLISWFGGYEIGSTGQFYDFGKVITSVIKPICQVTIVTAGTIYTPFSGDTLSRASNVLCEPIGRLFTIISRENQKQHGHNKHPIGEEITQYIKFVKDTVTTDIAYDAFETGIIKSVTSDIAGMIVRNPIRFVVELIKTAIPIFKFLPRPVEDYLVNIIKGFAKTYLLTPTARAAEDIFILKNELEKIYLETNDSNFDFEPNTPASNLGKNEERHCEDFVIEALGICLPVEDI